MKYEELMIGNYVFSTGVDSEQRIAKIAELRGNCVFDSCYNVYYAESIDPIQITDDFLIKNGFEKQCIFENIIECYEGVYEWEKEVDGYFVSFRHCANHKDCDWCVHIDNADRDSVALVDIQYVHQLQNVMNVLGIKLNLIIE